MSFINLYFFLVDLWLHSHKRHSRTCKRFISLIFFYSFNVGLFLMSFSIRLVYFNVFSSKLYLSNSWYEFKISVHQNLRLCWELVWVRNCGQILAKLNISSKKKKSNLATSGRNVCKACVSVGRYTLIYLRAPFWLHVSRVWAYGLTIAVYVCVFDGQAEAVSGGWRWPQLQSDDENVRARCGQEEPVFGGWSCRHSGLRQQMGEAEKEQSRWETELQSPAGKTNCQGSLQRLLRNHSSWTEPQAFPWDSNDKTIRFCSAYFTTVT